MPKGYASQIIYGHKSGKRYKRDLIKLFEESAVKKENELRRELKNLEEERERNGGG
jgi:predicted nuclease of restriction endonuclease-like RecB superfamily